MEHARYNTDPPSVGATRQAPAVRMFDRGRTAAALAAGLIDGCPELPVPNDNMLIATLVAHGQPQFAAEELRGNPPIRLCALRFWVDVQNAAKGGKDAQDRVDVCRAAWVQLRRDQLISDIPGHTAGLWER